MKPEEKFPKEGDRIIVHENQKDFLGRDILKRNGNHGYRNTITNLHRYKRTGIIRYIVQHDLFGYKAEIILDEKGKEPVKIGTKDFDRIDGRLNLYKGEFSNET